MIAGLFLSKFGREGLENLGFSSYSEAYNALGYALGGKAASIKNYRQEFDPFFPNGRKGWHKREPRDHCQEMFDRFGGRTMEDLSEILSAFFPESGTNPRLPDELAEIEPLTDQNLCNESVAKRLITGMAAERFFEDRFPGVPEFKGCQLSNVTIYGCGFDYQIQPGNSDIPFIAVEVKGIAAAQGELTLTEKEHRVAALLRERYYLCVVSNFCDEPTLSLFRNPLDSVLDFKRAVRHISTVSWNAKFAV